MKINYERSFLRDIQGLRDKKTKQKLETILTQFAQADTINQIQHIKKLTKKNFRPHGATEITPHHNALQPVMRFSCGCLLDNTLIYPSNVRRLVNIVTGL